MGKLAGDSGSAKVDILSSLLSLSFGIIYGLLAWFWKDAPGIRAVTDSIVVALLVTILVLLWRYLRELPRLQGQVDHLLDMSVDMEGLQGLRAHFRSLEHGMAKLADGALSDYVKGFRKIESGFSIRGQEWALTTYERFWQIVLDEQRKLGPADDKRLILRITHSNDIGIWIRDENPNADILYARQEEFIREGGIIVRILVGKEKSLEDPRYIEVFNRMKQVGIDCHYTGDIKDILSYDFLWLRGPDDEEDDSGWALKWYSNMQGQHLSHCEFLDKAGDEIGRLWISIAKRVEAAGGDFNQIPNSRKIRTAEKEKIVAGPEVG